MGDGEECREAEVRSLVLPVVGWQPRSLWEMSLFSDLEAFAGNPEGFLKTPIESEKLLGQWVAQFGPGSYLPPSKNRKTQRRYNKILYKQRYLVEVFFHNIKRFRRIATRYDKTSSYYLAFV